MILVALTWIAWIMQQDAIDAYSLICNDPQQCVFKLAVLSQRQSRPAMDTTSALLLGVDSIVVEQLIDLVDQLTAFGSALCPKKDCSN